ncbi:MAG TPA: ATP-binding protein [Longimicrobium sp.]|nr:ATP-binding protein [Longimicrobium sp.]
MHSAEPLPFPAPRGSPGERLSHRAAAVAGALAELLDAGPADGGETAAARDFLRAMAAAAPGGDDGRRPDGPDPLDHLAAAFELAPVEVELLVLAGLADEHEGYAGVLRTLHPRSEPRATTGLAAQLLCDSPAERRLLRELLEAGPAVRVGMLRLGDEGPFYERSLLPADGLWSVLAGIDAWPPALHPEAAPSPSAGLEPWLAGPTTAAALHALASGEPWTVLVTADNDELALARGAALAARAGATAAVFVLPADAGVDLERLLSVHAAARGAVPVVRVAAGEGPGGAEAPAFATHPGPVVVCGRAGSVVVRGTRPVVEVAAPRLTASAREAMWRELLPEAADAAADLAARYTVEPATAAAAAGDARAVGRLERRAPRNADVGAAVRTRAGLALSSGVRLLRPAADWERLVLSPDRKGQLREAIDRLLHQSTVLDRWRFLEGRPGARGVRMLFAGPSGTGKTLAAEVVAAALGVDLLLVDVSRVVSKWIGETEKNLAEVFDVAERAQAVLFFDEADALFGRRTEVSDAHDRYANLETSYLLTRLERFEALAVLSTNLRQNIDPAFTRRMEFILDFEEPGPAERAALWHCHLPPGAPLDGDLSVPELAALYPVVGGVIRNAAVAAAFLAAAQGTRISRRHVVRAIRREYDKSGRAFPGPPSGMSAP